MKNYRSGYEAFYEGDRFIGWRPKQIDVLDVDLLRHIVYCKGCSRVKKHGEWIHLTLEDKHQLALHAGKWDILRTLCDICKEDANERKKAPA